MASDAEPGSKAEPLVDGRAAPRWAVVGIFMLLCIAAVALAREFLMPMMLAFLLTLVFTPLRRTLNRVGLPSPACAVLVIASLTIAIGIGITMLTEPITDYAARAPQIGFEIETKLRSLWAPVAEIAEAGERIDQLAAVGTEGKAPTVEVKEAGLTAQLAAVAPIVAAQAAFVLILLFFLIASGDMFYEKLVHVMPTFTDKRRALRIDYDIERRLAR